MPNKSFLKNTSGNVALTTALLIIPLLAAVGAAIDYTRLKNVRTDYQAAADAAVLSASTASGLTNNELTKLADDVFLTNIQSANQTDAGRLIFLNDGLRYEAEKEVPLTFMKVVGISDKSVEVTAEVATAITDVEIAMVLDTTGSMEPYLNNMKIGAIDFVNTIDTASNGQAKFSIVPFVASVNVGRFLSNMELDRNADSKYHANYMEDKIIFFENGATCGGVADPDGGSTSERSSLGYYFKELFGFQNAHAQAAGQYLGSFPDGWTSTGECIYSTPPKLNHFDLYSDMDVLWKGCVEARPAPFDVSNDPANGSADTKWVPYFWPDEEPRGATPTTHNYYFGGDYNADTRPIPDVNFYNWTPSINPIKYDSSLTFDIDETAPSTLGPNKACPDEVLPLNSDASIVRQKINDLSHWNDGGTVASEGIAWGMRMLTPEAPFTEGAATNDDLQKIMILFGDGKNELPVNVDNSSMISDYSAYGYVSGNQIRETGFMDSVYPMPTGQPRIDAISTQSQAMLDERMIAACDAAKAEDITVLTILFNETDLATQAVYRDCASSPDKALIASDLAGLREAFKQISSNILRMYLRK